MLPVASLGPNATIFDKAPGQPRFFFFFPPKKGSLWLRGVRVDEVELACLGLVLGGGWGVRRSFSVCSGGVVVVSVLLVGLLFGVGVGLGVGLGCLNFKAAGWRS